MLQSVKAIHFKYKAMCTSAGLIRLKVFSLRDSYLAQWQVCCQAPVVEHCEDQCVGDTHIREDKLLIPLWRHASLLYPSAGADWRGVSRHSGQGEEVCSKQGHYVLTGQRQASRLNDLHGQEAPL